MTSDQKRRLEIQIRTLELIRLELVFARDRLRARCAAAGLPSLDLSRQDASPANLPVLLVQDDGVQAPLAAVASACGVEVERR